MSLFSRGDKKKSKVQAWSFHFRTPGKASLGIPTAGHTLHVSPSLLRMLSCVHTQLELRLLQSLDCSFCAFMCPTRFVAHVIIIPINCCRTRSDNTFLLTRVVRHQGRKKIVPGWCVENTLGELPNQPFSFFFFFFNGRGSENKFLLQSMCRPYVLGVSSDWLCFVPVFFFFLLFSYNVPLKGSFFRTSFD